MAGAYLNDTARPIKVKLPDAGTDYELTPGEEIPATLDWTLKDVDAMRASGLSFKMIIEGVND